MILIDAQGLRASRPNRPLFNDLSLTLSDGDRIGVVGLNGCGKSTLLTIMSGDREPEAGVVRRGRNARVGALPQLPVLPAGTVRSAVCDGLDRQEWQGEAMLSRLGMEGLLDASTDQLSGGQKKRVALAALLAREWDALILDEPTNHLDLDAIAYLEDWLAAFPGGLLLVTHDRHVLDRVTNKVLEIDRGACYLHVPQERTRGSGYAAYLAARVEREAQAATEEQTRKNLARRELAWLRRGAPARTSKPKARIDSANALLTRGPQAKAREGELGLALGSSRLGSKGVEIHGVGFSWPGARAGGDEGSLLVLRPFDHMFEPGDRVGVVGPNGAGKSTLLDLVAGRLQPTHGSIEVGRTVKIGYYDQLGRDLDLNQRVRDAVAGDKGQPTIDDVKLMRQFWFDGDAQFAPISTLSGGERRRLQLLLTLLDQPNVLLLDEPTNDLDLDTLRALEEFLDDWPGILVVVSHDRVFLDRTVGEVLALDGNGRAAVVRGGVGGWLAQRAARPSGSAGSASAAPAPQPTATPNAARPVSKKSPSTLRHQLGRADRELAAAIEERDTVQAALVAVNADHKELVRISARLADSQSRVDAAEEHWLSLAGEAESLRMDLD
ncbi:MAG TPA: ABC-F family ATP-binding cassette domain-containing protein [Acidimicrobiia bacterium]|nr:ABC-F family ATP-binding cassette domain-containing protein [Acidimicrobiia bacterium]